MPSMPGAEIARPSIYRITLIQLAVLVCAGAALLAHHETVAVSWVAGGLAAILPQAYFARLAFRHSGATSARDIARSSYAGQVGKFMLSAAGFAVIFATVKPVSGFTVFVAYLAMLVIQIIGSWLLLAGNRFKQKRKS